MTSGVIHSTPPPHELECCKHRTLRVFAGKSYIPIQTSKVTKGDSNLLQYTTTNNGGIFIIKKSRRAATGIALFLVQRGIKLLGLTVE